jgi:hypothetical protein
MITAENWRAIDPPANTLRGFCDLKLWPSGLLLHNCSLHEQNGKRWVGLPGKPRLDLDRRQCVDAATGKRLWSPVVEIRSQAERERFQAAALAAVDRLRSAP